jgi:hypothetical protein
MGMDMDMAAWPHGRMGVVELSTFDRHLACGGDGVHSGLRSGGPWWIGFVRRQRDLLLRRGRSGELKPGGRTDRQGAAALAVARERQDRLEVLCTTIRTVLCTVLLFHMPMYTQPSCEADRASRQLVTTHCTWPKSQYQPRPRAKPCT